MPFSSGNYSAPSSPGAFNPAIAGQQATPTAWAALLADISTALSTAVLKDGTQTITQNIPLANHKITGLAAGTVSTDAATVGQIIAGTLAAADDTGTNNAYVIAPTIPIAAYARYQMFSFRSAHVNTTASTLAVSGLAAKTIKHLDGTDLLAGDILATELVQVMYDGTNFQLLSPTGMRGTASTWTAANAYTAAVQFGATTTLVGAALNEAKGTNIASATTTDIGAAIGNYVHVTGVTTITGLGTIQAGTRRVVVFDGILLLTHNATSLILPTAANITTAAGDCAEFESEGSGNWKCVLYQRASGAALVSSYTPPQTAYAYVTVSAGTATMAKQSGFTSITRTGAGTFTCVMSSAMPDANYRVLAMTSATLSAGQQGEWVFEDTAAGSRTTTTFYLRSRGDNAGGQDPDAISIQVFA